MKTTVEIPDSLLDAARKVAHRQNVTLRTLIVEGLRRVVVERKRSDAFVLRDASFGGDGLQPGVDESWERIRGQIYEGRGS